MIVVGALAGCVSTASVQCEDGTTCPADTECRVLGERSGVYCATEDQLLACNGRQQLDACPIDGEDIGLCHDGVCIEAACGNLLVEPGELCDDGNALAADGCEPGCMSDGLCGTGGVDRGHGETCDDANLRDHDGCTSTCRDETLRWARRMVAPIPRSAAMVAYDTRRARLVMFGGRAGPGPAGLRSETWELDGEAWTRFVGPSPPAREGGTMAFDGERIVLYGGTLTNETWTFDGVQWMPHYTTVSPGRQAGHQMAYDSRRDRVVLFAGGTAPVTTWEWDGATWTQIVTPVSPPLRTDAMMAFDPVRGLVVLAGGVNMGLLRSDTWTYDGTNWTLVAGAGFPQMSHANMAFDPISQRLIVIDGCNDAPCVLENETLAFDGSVWTTMTQAIPPSPREASQMASTPEHIVMFGGLVDDSSNSPVFATDAWTFDGDTWREVETPGPRTTFLVANDYARREIVLFDDIDPTDNEPPETWVLSRRGWRKHSGGPEVDTGAMTFDHTNGNVVMFVGGASPQTWTWDGAAWTQKSPATSPTAYSKYVLSFAGTQVVLFGGLDAQDDPLSETWTWNGTTWSQLTLGEHPFGDPLGGSIGGYDELRDELVLADGSNITWTFDGTAWTSYPIQPPTLVKGQRLAWNPSLQQLVAITIGFTTWSWDGDQWIQLAPVGIPSSDLDLYNSIGHVTALDGTATWLVGSAIEVQNLTPVTEEVWQLRWDRTGDDELCDGTDRDGDMLNGCMDEDCAQVCTGCGDGTCNTVFENCRTCAADCQCVPVCGDSYCDAGEICPGDCP